VERTFWILIGSDISMPTTLFQICLMCCSEFRMIYFKLQMSFVLVMDELVAIQLLVF